MEIVVNRPYRISLWSGVVGALVLLLAASASLVLGGLAQAQDDGTIMHPENSDAVVAEFSAEDPEGTAITSWKVTGTDAAAFMIENGVLRFMKSPNYEMPTDVGGTGESTAAADDNKYEITVEATDSTGRTAMKAVMVEVENVDEAGTLTLSALRPQSATAFTATLTDPDTDPDGATSNLTWQWKKSRNKSGSFSNIDGATSGSYTPVDGDLGYYLRATVTYTDPEGANKTAMVTSEYQSQNVRGTNKAPKFADDQDPKMDGDQAEAAREVNENVDPGTFVGDPVTADPQDGDVLTYTLEGTDADSFDIDWATGQIKTKAALDFEAKPTYEVTVRATDPAGIPQADVAVEANSDTVTVNIAVKDVNEPPAVTGTTSAGTNDGAELAFEETAGAITNPLDTYTADDPESDTPITWSTAGADGDKFTAVAGALQFKVKPDYENPTDANMDNVYEVTVTATAGGKAGTKMVKVTVTNEDEDGTVTLSQVQPTQGIAVKAELMDPDGNVRSLTWQWSITGADAGSVTGVTATADGDIKDATSDTYTPVAGDVGGTLTATASYFDGESAPDATIKKTMAQEAGTVRLDSRNKAPVFDDGDMATREVEENTKALAGAADDDAADADDDGADNVGAALTATDIKADGTTETLIYSLGGTDAGKFRVRQNGQIEVAAGTDLDYETKPTYMVTVIAADPFGASSSIDVTIMVKNLNEVPVITGDKSPKYDENGTGLVATYTASDPERTAITSWKVTGTDAAAFMIENGVLRFMKSPNYEMPTDVGGTGESTAAADDNKYEITVEATDSTGRTAMKAVMVEVENVDEAGTLTLSALRPQSATAFTATLTDPDTDPDGATSNLTWQWKKSRNKSGSFSNIDGATSGSYTPVDGDLGYYLRATVTYTDPEGANKTAMVTSEYQSQNVRGTNKAPKFADDQDPKMDGDQAEAAREVNENVDPGTFVGDPVTADPQDGDVLTYTLEGTDADSFDIDWATGQIKTKAALDFEAKPTYEVTVRATDPAGIPQADVAVEANSDTVTVNIAVKDVNEPPAVTGTTSAGTNDGAELAFEETAGAITNPLDTYTADDPESDTPITWSTAGADGDKFTAVAGALQFKVKPDYENPTDANMDNVYEVTVTATAGGKAGTKMVKVTVTNEDEDGTVTLSQVQPTQGIAVKAELMDPDGNVRSLTWQWSITGADAGSVTGVTATADGDIKDATSDTYTPVAGDVGGTLTATASYFDGESAPDATIKKTMAQEAGTVALDTRNKAPVFDDGETATREVEENTKALVGAADDDAADATDGAGDNVGAALAATDLKADGTAETLIYSLGGTDSDKFRVRQNGQIEVAAGTDLDYETKPTYMVMVIAADPFGASSSIDVTIMVKNLDEVPVISRGSGPMNQAPTFPAETADRSVDEDEPVGTDVGPVVSATDPNPGDTLTYTLEGTDASSFTIDGASGQLQTAVLLDRTTKSTYTVVVKATDDGGLSHTVMVTITVNAATTTNHPPQFPFPTAQREIAENTAAGMNIGAPVAATDADNDRLTHTLGGADMADFGIDRATGQLKTKSPLDYESKITYTVTVTARDTRGGSDEVTVTITVIDVDETQPLLTRYDANGDGCIELAEARVAVGDHFKEPRGTVLSLPDARKVVGLHFECRNRQSQ